MQVSKHSPPVSLRAVISPQLCIQLIGISKTSTVRVVFWYLFLLVLYLWFCINFDYMPLEITFGLSVRVWVFFFWNVEWEYHRKPTNKTPKQKQQQRKECFRSHIYPIIVFMKATTNEKQNKNLSAYRAL